MDPRLREIGDTFGAGDYQRARDLAQALLDTRDDAALRTEASAFIVESYLAEGDFRAARGAAESFELQDTLGRIDEVEREYRTEITRLRDLAANAPEAGQAAEALLLMGRAHWRVGLLDRAIQSYDEAIAQEPNGATAAQALGESMQLLLSARDYARALRRLRTYLRARPRGVGAAQAHMCIARVREARGERREADVALRAAVLAAPSEVVANHARGLLADLHYDAAGMALEKADQESAIEEWRQAIHVDPCSERRAWRLYQLSSALARRGRYGEAKAALKELLRPSKPSYREKHDSAGELLARIDYEQGRVEEAVRGLEEVLATCTDADRRAGIEALLTRYAEDRTETGAESGGEAGPASDRSGG